MPIEGQSKFIPEAEEFIRLLQPRRIIPMHYWSDQYKEDFLVYLEEQNKNSSKKYQIQKFESSQVIISEMKVDESPIQIISLKPDNFQ